jgi:Tfp pilus assembly protein PilO
VLNFHGGEKLMALNTPMKIVLTVVVIILIGIGFYLLDYSSKFNEIKDMEAELVKKEEMLKVNQERVRRLPEQLAKKEMLEIQLDKLIQERLPQEDAMIFVPRFIQSMEQLIAKERVATGDRTMEVISITPGKLEPPSTEAQGDSQVLELFPKQPFQVNLKARYPTVIHLLHQLAALKLERLVTITNITLNPEGNAPGPGMSPTLRVTMPVVAYLNEGKERDKK